MNVGGSARSLAHAGTNMMKVEGEKLQQLRLEIEDIITRFESKADDFNARQEAYIAKYTERAFVMLSIPPLPDLSRRIARNSVVDESTELTTDDFVSKLQGGGMMVLKHGRRGKPHKRRLWLTQDCQRLNVSDSSGMSNKGLPLSEVMSGRIVQGFRTAVFERSGTYAASEDHCMSIIATSRSLDIECETQEERDMLVKGLNKLVLHLMEGADEQDRREQMDRSRARSSSTLQPVAPFSSGSSKSLVFGAGAGTVADASAVEESDSD